MKKAYRDFFLHFDILVMFGLFIGFILYISYTGVNEFVLLSFFLGVVTYALLEYVIHRFLFHMKPPKNLRLLKLIKRLHYDHHVDPNNLKLLFLPLWYSIPSALVLSTIYYSIVQSVELTIPFTMGLTAMFLIYEWKHYIAHVSIKPKTAVGRWLKRIHLLHHYKNENYWYGVSNPFFDMIFGTWKDEKEVETSPTAKDLENRKR